MKGQIEKRGDGVYRLRWYLGRDPGKKVFKPKGWIPPWLLRTPLIFLPLPRDPDFCLLNPNDPSCLQACPVPEPGGAEGSGPGGEEV